MAYLSHGNFLCWIRLTPRILDNACWTFLTKIFLNGNTFCCWLHHVQQYCIYSMIWYCIYHCESQQVWKIWLTNLEVRYPDLYWENYRSCNTSKEQPTKLLTEQPAASKYNVRKLNILLFLYSELGNGKTRVQFSTVGQTIIAVVHSYYSGQRKGVQKAQVLYSTTVICWKYWWKVFHLIDTMIDSIQKDWIFSN